MRTRSAILRDMADVCRDISTSDDSDDVLLTQFERLVTELEDCKAANPATTVRQEFAALSDRMLAFLFTLWDEAQQAKGERSDIPLLLARAEEAYRTPQWPATTMVGNVRQMLAEAVE